MNYLTPWFVGGEKPYWKGVYERYKGMQTHDYAYWNGNRWSPGCVSPDEAIKFKGTKAKSIDKHLPWRGLREKP